MALEEGARSLQPGGATGRVPARIRQDLGVERRRGRWRRYAGRALAAGLAVLGAVGVLWGLGGGLLLGGAGETLGGLLRGVDLEALDGPARIRGARDLLWGLGGLLAALALLAAVGLLAWRQRTDARRADVERHRAESEILSEAFAQLGQGDAALRLGAVLNLERLARDAPGLHRPIVETLCAYLREQRPAVAVEAGAAQPPAAPLPGALQAAVTALGRRDVLREPPEYRLELQDVDLWGVEAAGASLDLVRLTGSRLERGDLRGARLAGAELDGARLAGARLQGAHLRGADLSGADLTGAELQGAHLEAANLSGACLQGANLNEAYLKGARIQRADLAGASLWRAHLKEAELDGASLEGADLWKANLEGLDLWGAHLKGASLEDAYLGSANLEGANLEDARLSGAVLRRARLERAHLRGADLEGADLGGADLTDASLAPYQLAAALIDDRTVLPGPFQRPEWQE